MNTYAKMAIVAGLMTAVGIVAVVKNGGTCATCPPGATPVNPSEFETAVPAPEAAVLPRLVELGSTTCIPCKAMKPIIEELTAELEGRLEVEFVDVHRQAELAAHYDVRVIPTQVFLDAKGQELFRHEGFFAKENILAKWKELGFEFAPEAGN